MSNIKISVSKKKEVKLFKLKLLQQELTFRLRLALAPYLCWGEKTEKNIRFSFVKFVIKSVMKNSGRSDLGWCISGLLEFSFPFLFNFKTQQAVHLCDCLVCNSVGQLNAI